MRLWRNAWGEFIPFLDYDVEIRKIICTTKAIESLNARYRRAVRARGHFPNDQAALKCLYLVTRSLDPTRHRSGTMGHPMEGSAQRLRHHLRGPHQPLGQLRTPVASYTGNLTLPKVVTPVVACFCVRAMGGATHGQWTDERRLAGGRA